MRATPNLQIIILQGAGVSTNAGIRDFRSPKFGFYSQIKDTQRNNYLSLKHFVQDQGPLCELVQTVSCSFCPTKTHAFGRLLQDKGILLRLYTQNIDSLEKKAGIKPEMIVPAHGTVETGRCIDCQVEVRVTFLLAQTEYSFWETFRNILFGRMAFPDALNVEDW